MQSSSCSLSAAFPNTYKYTGKERDSESGLDNFGARYNASSMGRFMTPDWAAKPVTVPYAHFGNPQSLNLYSYVQNNPTTTGDPDGHCPSDNPNCKNVTVQAEVAEKPHVVQNETIKDINGKVVAKATGVEGQLVDTVKVNGTPTSGVQVTETNQNTDTRNGKPINSTLEEGKGTTNENGQFGDKIGMAQATDGSKATNNSIKQDYQNNVWTSTDKQTLTLTFTGGATCSATSTRTLTNAGGNGYTLTTTQPVVTTPQPPQ